MRDPQAPRAGPLSVLVVAGVLAIILREGHRLTNGRGPATGQTADAPPSGWGTLNAKAVTRVQQQDAACRPQPLTGAAALRHDAPGHDLTSVLSVLAGARARQPADLGRRAASDLRRTTDPLGRGIYLRYVRHGERNGISYYFVPAANVNQLQAIPERCYHEQRDSFRKLATQRPAGQQAALIAYETTSLQQQRLVAEHPAGVCLATTGPGGSGTRPCVNAVSLQQFNASTGDGGYGNDHETVTPRIVPDGVATVTAPTAPRPTPAEYPTP